MSYDTLRKGRFSSPDQLYFVTTVTAGRESLFLDTRVGRLVVRAMRDAEATGHVESLAWVLMPDHLHWLLRLCPGGDLGRVVRAAKGPSARAVNAFLGRRGPVWQRAYYDHAVRVEEDVREIARYIVANPLRAGLVRDLGEYSLWDCVWV
jgi:REP element-mobilizing transposase RayT